MRFCGRDVAVRRAWSGCQLDAGTDARSPRWRRKRSGDAAAVRFVDKHEVLVHPFWIERSLKHEQILRPDQTMLHSGLKMKLVSRSERLDCEGAVGRTPRQDEPRAFPYLQAFILSLVLLKSEVATSADYAIPLNSGVLMQHDDHTTPRR